MSETMMSPIPGTYNGIPVYCVAIDSYWQNKEHYDSQDKYFVLSDPNKTKHYVVWKGMAKYLFNYDTKEFEKIAKSRDIKKIYDEEAWFAQEVSYIQVKHYVGTKFYAARILNLDAKKGEELHHVIIVPVDEFYVAQRDMGFEVVNLHSLIEHIPDGWAIDRCDLQLDTGRTKVDGQLDELIMQSKPLHDHIDSLYHYNQDNKLGYAFTW